MNFFHQFKKDLIYLIKICSHQIILLLTLCLAVRAQQEAKPVLAFPGAEGFGQYVTGGRGGKVIKVSNLHDHGQGSFRAAVESLGPRIVVFEVSGVIALEKGIQLLNPNITINGQTAPGEGITLTNYPFSVNTDNVIIRFMRFRMGDEKHVEADALGGFEHKDIMVDHCSMSWSTDECVSFYNNDNLTLQWCIITESLRNSAHIKGAHGYGGIWGGKNVSFHHNLMANHDSRNPRFGEREGSKYALTDLVDMRNNVFYNWGSNSAYGGEAMHINIVNNFYKPGPATKIKNRIFSIDKYMKNPTSAIYNRWGKFYINGNVIEGEKQVTGDNWKFGVFNQFNSRYAEVSETEKSEMRLASPHEIHNNVKTQSAEQAYRSVLSKAGACLKRDAIDLRTVENVVKGSFTADGSSGDLNSKNGIIDKASDVGGLSMSVSMPALQDSDEDGIPDDWEKANGLNPNLADSHKRTIKKDYDNIEVYCNSLVTHILK